MCSTVKHICVTLERFFSKHIQNCKQVFKKMVKKWDIQRAKYIYNVFIYCTQLNVQHTAALSINQVVCKVMIDSPRPHDDGSGFDYCPIYFMIHNAINFYSRIMNMTYIVMIDHEGLFSHRRQ